MLSSVLMVHDPASGPAGPSSCAVGGECGVAGGFRQQHSAPRCDVDSDGVAWADDGFDMG
jgi:hypothetical protein